MVNMVTLRAVQHADIIKSGIAFLLRLFIWQEKDEEVEKVKNISVHNSSSSCKKRKSKEKK